MKIAAVIKTLDYEDDNIVVTVDIYEDGMVNTVTYNKAGNRSQSDNYYIRQGKVLQAIKEGNILSQKALHKKALSVGYTHYPKLDSYGYFKFKKDGTCYLTPKGSDYLAWIQRTTWPVVV